jgi:AraC family cel operon transcriptional repressor
MPIHLHARDIIDPETEAHYSFKTIWPGENTHGQIGTTTSHDHDFYELFLITHGRIWHLVNRTELLLTAGHLVLVRPADRHGFRQYELEDCGLINLAFPAGTATALFAYLGEGFRAQRLLRAPTPPTVLLAEPQRQATVAQFNRLNAISHTDKQRIRTQLRLLLAELLGQHFEEGTYDRNDGIDATNADSWLAELCARMEEPENLRGGVSTMQMLAHTSPEHLSRTVRRELGCTPTEYVNRLRLTYAANLLLHTDRPIVDISYEVGLENLSYFYRIFKARYGTTPARFRARNRGRKRAQPIP